MLVLLIIFLITIPVVSSRSTCELPKERNVARADQAREHRHRREQGRRRVLEHAERRATAKTLFDRLKKIAVMQPQPEVHIRGDLEGALRVRRPRGRGRQRAGILKIGFITEPPPRGGG